MDNKDEHNYCLYGSVWESSLRNMVMLLWKENVVEVHLVPVILDCGRTDNVPQFSLYTVMHEDFLYVKIWDKGPGR